MMLLTLIVMPYLCRVRAVQVEPRYLDSVVGCVVGCCCWSSLILVVFDSGSLAVRQFDRWWLVVVGFAGLEY